MEVGDRFVFSAGRGWTSGGPGPPFLPPRPGEGWECGEAGVLDLVSFDWPGVVEEVGRAHTTVLGFLMTRAGGGQR